MLTTSRLMSTYSGKGKAIFIEGGTIKTIIPIAGGKATAIDDTINDTINDTVKDTVNDTVKKRLVQIILQLYNKPSQRISELAEKLYVSEVTIKRDVQKIRPLVEYRGSQKTGGYFLKDYMLSKLDKK